MAKVFLTVGLGFGDEGKGTTVDYLVRQHQAPLVVRYNGGAQAAHNVVTDDGRHHTFAQWSSGTFAGARTYFSEDTILNPTFAAAEAKHLESVGVRDPYALLTVHERALVTTPYHVALNRLREMARTGRHGSCGMGIGETVLHNLRTGDGLRVGDLRSYNAFIYNIERIREYCHEQARALELDRRNKHISNELDIFLSRDVVNQVIDHYIDYAKRVQIVIDAWLRRQLDEARCVVFEGAQGVLLDQDHGFQPHTTWTDCTLRNAVKLVREHDVQRLGILRAYQTRHGAGPLPTESSAFDVLSADDHNRLGPWQGSFRSGALDLALARYAVDVVGDLDGLVITHLDRLKLMGDLVPVCFRYTADVDGLRVCPLVARPHPSFAQQANLAELLSGFRRDERDVSSEPTTYVAEVTKQLGLPARILSFGPKASDKEDVVHF